MASLNFNSIKYALLSGLISACLGVLLWLFLFRAPFLPIFCGIGIAIPVLFTGFACGTVSACIASLTAAALLCLILPPGIGLSLAVYFFLPALLSARLMSLKFYAGGGARKDTASSAEPDIAFYPLSAAVFQTGLAVAFVSIGVLFYLLSLSNIEQYFNGWADRIINVTQNTAFYDILSQNGNPRDIIRNALPVTFAISLAVYGFLFQLAALYCSMRLAAAWKRLNRPLCCWPADLRMPPLALLLFVLLWIAAFAAGGSSDGDASTLTLCLGIIASVLWVGFCAAGLAALHQATPGPLIWLRVIIYICLFSGALTPVIFFGLTVMGLIATPLRSLRMSGNSSS